MNDHANQPDLPLPVRDALVSYLLCWADDELVLGHRDSEWTGFAPMIEEDVAFSSIAQDELGHATLLYTLIAGLTGDDIDRLALRRPAGAYRHAILVERPNGDWAYTIARHYLYDLADACRVEVAGRSSYEPLSAVARKMAREEHYHQLHDAAWWDRLRDGTPESRERLVAAAGALLPPAIDLFGETPDEPLLVAAGILPESSAPLLNAWRERMRPLLTTIEPRLLQLLESTPTPRTEHDRTVSEHFQALHAEMTMVSASGLGERW